MTQTDYKLLIEQLPNRLENKIKSAMMEGWYLHGPTEVLYDPRDDNLSYIQAMFMYSAEAAVEEGSETVGSETEVNV